MKKILGFLLTFSLFTIGLYSINAQFKETTTNIGQRNRLEAISAFSDKNLLTYLKENRFSVEEIKGQSGETIEEGYNLGYQTGYKGEKFLDFYKGKYDSLPSAEYSWYKLGYDVGYTSGKGEKASDLYEKEQAQNRKDYYKKILISGVIILISIGGFSFYIREKYKKITPIKRFV